MEIPELTAPDAYPLSDEQVLELRALVLRKVRFQLRSASREQVEDVAHDVLVEVLVYIRRVGMPDRIEALAGTVVRRRCIDLMRGRKVRGHAVDVDEYAELLADVRALDWLVEIEEGTALIAARVAEYYRRHEAPCLELVAALMLGKAFSELAEETNQSHDALRQRWVRCKAHLKAAIARGEPGLEGLPGWKGGIA